MFVHLLHIYSENLD